MTFFNRGSPHVHGLFWIDGAPDVSNLANASDEYLDEVIEYFSKLVEAIKPDIYGGSPDTHPCRTTYGNVKDFEKDLAQLLHKVQRHTCSPDYCYKMNKRKHIKECRFKFPFDPLDQATIKKGENGHLEFKPRRNDPKLN